MLTPRRVPIPILTILFFLAPPGFGEDLLIHGGTVVTAEGSQLASVRVRGEKIHEVGALEPESGERVIDATGLWVLPGGIDPHVHLSNVGDTFIFVDDFESGSRAALAGGITTLGHMAVPNPDELPLAALARERAVIEANALADIFVHSTIVDPSDAAIAELEALVDAGQPSIKIFMPFGTFDAQFGSFLRLMERAAQLGIRIAIHCEDAHTLEYTVNALVAAGKESLLHYPESRPVVSEWVATERAIGMAESTGASIYIVHLAAERALDAAAAVRDRLPVYVETRPLYLHLTEDRYRGPEGALYVGMPPIRSARDQEALWEGIVEGTVDTVASDHAPWSREQKLDPALTIETPRPGVNNLQVMLPMLFSEGVNGRRITPERFVAVTSTNAAKLFGLYPRKGAIASGSDADLALWNPAETRVIRDTDAISRAAFSIYAGTRVTGWPVLTLLRGEVVYEEGQVRAATTSGRLIAREPIGADSR